MPTNHRRDNEGAAKSKKRGSVKNGHRLAAFVKPNSGGGGDWGECHSELLLGVVTGITSLGGAVTFGLSRDKGAFMVALLLDDKRETLWFNGDDDLNDKLGEVIDTLGGIT